MSTAHSCDHPQTLNIVFDADGIAVISIAVPDRTMNVLTLTLQAELAEAVEQLFADASVCGIILSSGKPGAFMAGADVNVLLDMLDAGCTVEQGAALSRGFSRQLRRLESGGKPIACAMNGLALGGGFELALACHYRVLADDASVGLPEVGLGLLPGAGGTQRLSRLIGIEKAEPLLVSGKTIKAVDARTLGLVDAIAPAADVIEIARAWLLTNPQATQPWDEIDFQVPGGVGMQSAQKTPRNYPAAGAILACIREGVQVDIDAGLEIESNYFGQLLADPVAGNLMRTLFINKGEADKLIARPEGIAKSKVARLAVLGAGMMGAGIAYVAAKARIDVVLLDSTQEQAEKGKQHSAKLEQKKLARGDVKKEQVDTLLARIKPTNDYADLANCDLVVEAVFESRRVKADVAVQAGAQLSNTAVFASNTSTLPISELALAYPRPANFIGLHFFSPVDKMPLVEVIVGRETSRETLAKALDFVGQIKKTPIVVNDSPGFYTSRVFGSYFQEGLLMLDEGIAPALIESAASAAGMPIGPLAVCDEVTMELQLKVIEQNLAAGNMHTPQMPRVLSVLRKMVIDLKRIGRRSGTGFYDYAADGNKQLWPDLGVHFPAAEKQPAVGDLSQRFLYIQALEAVHCMEANVVTRAADADLGSILGVGFPSWTGGTLSYIDMIGLPGFVVQCERFAALLGPRFEPSSYLRNKAGKGEHFHSRISAAVSTKVAS